MAELKESNWLCIATEGRAVDGRDMPREVLISVAKNYNSNFYSALIWNEHSPVDDRVYQLNLGLVLELKTEEENNKLKLYAKLAANKFLLALNEDNQKLFCSVEITQDFPEGGQFYLTGLAVTDQPALPYISQLKFSNQSQAQANIRTELQAFSLTTNSTEQHKTGLNTMTEEEIQALKDQLAAQAAKIEELEAALAEKNAEKAEEIAEEITTLANEAVEQAEAVSDEVTKEEFIALKKANIELNKKISNLEIKFSRAIKLSTTKTPDLNPTTGANLNMFV